MISWESVPLVLLLFAVFYLLVYPQHLLPLFFYTLKFGVTLYMAFSSCCSRIQVWNRKAKREFLLKTKTFEDRPVMKRPGASLKKKAKF